MPDSERGQIRVTLAIHCYEPDEADIPIAHWPCIAIMLGSSKDLRALLRRGMSSKREENEDPLTRPTCSSNVGQELSRRVGLPYLGRAALTAGRGQAL